MKGSYLDCWFCLLLGIANFALIECRGRSRRLSSKAGKEIPQDDNILRPKSKSTKSNRRRTEVSFYYYSYLLIIQWICAMQYLHSQTFSYLHSTQSFFLIRKEEASYVDGISAMDMNGPNARDVSNAFGSSIKTNSFGAWVKCISDISDNCSKMCL